MVLRRSLRCRCCLQCRGGAASAFLCRGGAGVVVPVLRRYPRHGGDAVQRRCCAVARRGGAAALAVLLLWRCGAVALLLLWRCCGLQWQCCCRGRAAAVAVLLPWPCCCRGRAAAVAVLLQWRCCAVACRGGAAAVAVLCRGLPQRCCAVAGSGRAALWPAVAVLRYALWSLRCLQWPCGAVACSGGAAVVAGALRK